MLKPVLRGGGGCAAAAAASPGGAAGDCCDGRVATEAVFDWGGGGA